MAASEANLGGDKEQSQSELTHEAAFALVRFLYDLYKKRQETAIIDNGQDDKSNEEPANND